MHGREHRLERKGEGLCMEKGVGIIQGGSSGVGRKGKVEKVKGKGGLKEHQKLYP